MILDSGELQITYPAGFSRRCKITLDNKTLIIAPPTCLLWDTMGPSISLEKQ